MPVTTGNGAMRLSVAAVTQYLAARKRINERPKRRVVLLRAVPSWDGPQELSWGTEQQARIVPGTSPLAIHELVLAHLGPDADGPQVLVVLTDREESELDPGILARVHRKRVETVDSWNLVQETFAATERDPRLSDEGWAAEALLDATPPGGWPRLSGGWLSRRVALSSLALRRLRLGRYASDAAGPGDGDPDAGRPDADGLDIRMLLRWSLAPGGPEQLGALRRPEREGLIAFLSEAEQAGAAGRVLFALVEADHGPDAVPFGLLCAALWLDAPADTDTYRARGRIERWLGDPLPATGEALDTFLSTFGQACQEFVAALLAAGDTDEGEAGRAARRTADRVLGRASELSRQFGIEQQARHSTVLPEGLNERFTSLGHALQGTDLDAVLAGLAAVQDHGLATGHDARVRTRRARMAARLVHWLATGPATDSARDVPTVAAGIDRHVAETGWADQALDHIEAGGDPDPALKSAYDLIGERVREARKEIDCSFAKALERWTAAGTGPGSMLTVETFLPRVVKPVVTGKSPRRVLLLVLDGMSAGIAAELAEELRRNWAEYDPMPDTSSTLPRRRAMAAALPTVTAVSRTSLFAAELMTGGQANEKRLFPQHRFWGNAKAAVFHKDDLRGETAGSPFSEALTDALKDETVHVAVVLNTIDDRLAKEQKLGDATWRLEHIGELRELLREAAERGMAVLLTSDHGHVVDRRGARLDCADIVSARYRLPGGPLVDGEVTLSGPRVVRDVPGGEIVALWDRDLRYTAQRAGYHGGASLAEFAIPVLAFLPFRSAPPKGWRELGDQRPAWWRLETEQTQAESLSPLAQASAESAAVHPPASVTVKESTDALFDLEAQQHEVLPEPEAVPVPEPEPAPAPDDLATSLLASETFQEQLSLVARKPPLGKIEAAVRALLDTGTLPVTALAQRAGYPTTRADGFAAVLGQVLNYDGVQVLETLPDGRTLRLNTVLLREQFDVR
ncbi:BREX-2 system phosphatase PglZ [Actinomadura nitritigenes]|uniref:BREX-2 system phosphatase PglZ n=1 Tax=Actinomadura nitritigenes TaxID=134602 RepID=A0ABS3QTJ7_9ACTN|nr:BREX-2 system phosphatase PglZ [Actinomadura nitritigenes]MBO2437294.1 BREX-2 system phosphatase PglZ [Actinomadura nitritigenes]